MNEKKHSVYYIKEGKLAEPAKIRESGLKNEEKMQELR